METSAKQTQSRAQQMTVSITIRHERNRMNMGGRAMELEGGVATDTGLSRGAQEGSPGQGPGVGTRRARQRSESKALLCITCGKQKEG